MTGSMHGNSPCLKFAAHSGTLPGHSARSRCSQRRLRFDVIYSRDVLLRATPNDPSKASGSGNYAISAFLLRCMSPEMALLRSAGRVRIRLMLRAYRTCWTGGQNGANDPKRSLPVPCLMSQKGGSRRYAGFNCHKRLRELAPDPALRDGFPSPGPPLHLLQLPQSSPQIGKSRRLNCAERSEPEPA